MEPERMAYRYGDSRSISLSGRKIPGAVTPMSRKFNRLRLYLSERNDIMNKLVLKSDKSFILDDIQLVGDRLSFAITVQSFDRFVNEITTEAISEIKIYTGKNLSGVYEGYTTLLPYVVDASGTKVTVTLKREFEDLLQRYKDNKIDEISLDIAVNKKQISEKERDIIIKSKK
jgi:hypothetical protein